MMGSLTLSVCADSVIAQVNEAHYGIYQIEAVEKFQGGIITEEKAKETIGTQIVICPNKYQQGDFTIASPVYKFEQVKLSQEEGVIPSKDYSYFHGFMPQRTHIEAISVFEPTDLENLYTRLEVIGKDKLLEMFSGYYFKMSKKSACSNTTKQ